MTCSMSQKVMPGLNSKPLLRPTASGRRPTTVFATATIDPPLSSKADVSGLRSLPESARTKALDRKANKFEKIKVEKCGSTMWSEVHELSALLREGKTQWEDLNLDDIEVRLKWAGLFHRGKRTPKRFMMRIKAPNGELDATQLRALADCIRPYGAEGCADITTRANIQLRGLKLEDADGVINRLWENKLTSYCTGMDNVRNLTGNPIAGVDPHELIDTRPLLYEMQDMITNFGKGRDDFANLPRKINICISSTRDDFPHTQINDLGFEAVTDPATGEVVFNVVVGGYFSIKRNFMSIPMDTCVTQEQLMPFVDAVLYAFRDHGPRGDRQKTRLIWMIEEMGVEKYREMIGEYMGGITLRRAVHAQHEGTWERRDLLGVHPQKQEGLFWVGACVPAGRLTAEDFDEFARVAETYGDGTTRLTCEENILFVNVPEANLKAMLAEPIFTRHTVTPGKLLAGLVSCTGSQFCGFGLVETKGRAVRVAEELERQLELPRNVRLHWTGCPNSCGQAQVGDIGIMGAPAKLNGKAVEGVKLFLGGKIGENPALATEFEAGIPAADEHLIPKLREVLIEHFGATPRSATA